MKFKKSAFEHASVSQSCYLQLKLEPIKASSIHNQVIHYYENKN